MKSKSANELSMDYVFSGALRTNMLGFQKLMDFYHRALEIKGGRLNLDFGNTSFFDANMTAVLLAILDKLKLENRNHVNINLDQINTRCDVLNRNGFTSLVKGVNNPDVDDRKTTVPLMTFKATEADKFVSYIENDFLTHRGLHGKLSGSAFNRIKESYLEIFANVDLHAETNKPLYTCGQYYPTKKEFKFTIIDVGVGFLKKIARKDPQITSYSQAIDWALKGHTTKKGTTMGGTGLSTILRYCVESEGEFHIISGDCYWVFTGTKIVRYSLGRYFCGTTVHLIFHY